MSVEHPILDLMINRSSQPRLELPGPNQEELEQVFQCALRSPDHMRLRPWRYLTIEGDGLNALGEVFLEAALSNGKELNDAQISKCKNMPLRAPLMIVGIASVQECEKVPREEQLISAGVGMGYMLLALQAMGYGGMWRTGDMAHSEHVKSKLGLAQTEEIIGFLYVGTPAGEGKPVPPALDSQEFVKAWP